MYEVSVLVKTLNEEENIGRTLESVMNAVQGMDAEVIVADSLSSDRTVEIARRFPVKVVQLVDANERCCGIGAQLGFQHSLGRFVLVMDGDMVLERRWLLTALDRLRSSPGLAGIGGLIDDVNLENIEFRARQQRQPKDMAAGIVDRLNGGGLYRRAAIEDVGYLTHRSLHACEELELGVRLVKKGWLLERLPIVSVHHYGYTVPMWALIRRRWQSHYVDGAGELLRSSFGQPWFWDVVNYLRHPLSVIAWWFTMLLLLACSTLFGAPYVYVLIGVSVVPLILMIAKKRSVGMGLYSILAWSVDAAGFCRGLFGRLKNPASAIGSSVVVAKTPSSVPHMDSNTTLPVR